MTTDHDTITGSKLLDALKAAEAALPQSPGPSRIEVRVSSRVEGTSFATRVQMACSPKSPLAGVLFVTRAEFAELRAAIGTRAAEDDALGLGRR